jgi:hypothetical protein
LVDRRVLPKNIVPHPGLHHGVQHSGSGSSNCV